MSEPSTPSDPDTGSTGTQPLLEISSLVVDYRTGREVSTAVNDVNITVNPGEFVSLVGESGSGKTTVVLAALGLLPANARVRQGSISYETVDVSGWNDRKMSLVRGNYVGFIPQDPNTSLNPVKRIGRQVVEAVRYNTPPQTRRGARWNGEAGREQALESLRTAGLSDAEKVFDQYPHELSGGMKQRALIAIALAGKPKIIVADEPTSALDVTVARRILDHLVTLGRELGIGVLLITHDLGVALERSHRILVMRDGAIVDEGAPDTIAAQASDDYTRRLLKSAPTRDSVRLTPTTASITPVATDSFGGQPALTARNITRVYRSRVRGTHNTVHALDNVSLTLRPGTTHAIVGESGAGKSTLARILAGLAAADSGTVHIGERELTTLRGNNVRHTRRNLQFVFQNPFTSLDPRYTVARIIAEPLQAFGLVPGKTARAQLVSELLDAVALDPDLANRLPRQLSGGQRQRVAIARALALEPEILVLDEAVSALDVSVQAQILQLLVDLQSARGLSYVFVTHDLGVVRLIADDVTVMKGGRVIETGTVSMVFTASEHPYTRELIDAIPGARRTARSYRLRSA
ncbi:MAG: ABC transporter ATP-binding protein [Gordonia sp. (in: high G+C Gram-positive bacteria)]